ncbi:DUF883 family protein [Asticcacaulis solisilvae]|uniref:DUF883 family protein n=1 Tax=Asticcacaulis solisilvae TaxID=1217274 RepID=UPI003FD83D3A
MISTATKVAANVTKASAENDLKSAADDLVADGRAAIDNVSDYANEAGQKFRSFVDRTLESTNKVSSGIQDEVRLNPVRSSLIALGAGFILGALLTRR